MNEPLPLNTTADIPHSGDGLDAGLAAAFGPDSGLPLPAIGSVLRALGSELPSVLRVLLREPDSLDDSPVFRPSSKEMPDQQDPASSLQLHGEIARGGMGAILKGRDVDLGREVAVKVLLGTHQGKTEMLQRFVEEAQISGQLQHPSITPVYGMGQFTDKRPYFTMKLVKGKTLAAELAARKSPQEEQPRFVGIFAQICQALAYAHARGVIHRDLKPSNVMVGAFGEVQVMDWGLAKVLKEGGIADERNLSRERQPTEVSVIRTQRSEGSSTADGSANTQVGTLLGTPAFMAPEQARGEVDLVDERADVFGLGAMLCAILTGQPPYIGKPAEIAYQARAAKLEDAFARLECCGADSDLIAMTKRCLAAELWERPRDAGEVADQVTAYQQSVAERLLQAELAQTEARARAEEEAKTRAQAEARLVAERRARRLTAGLAAAVLVALTLAGGGGLWYQHLIVGQREEAARRETELREAVVAALDKVADLRQRARWDEARAVLEQVRQRLGPSGPEDLRRQVEQAGADLALVDRLDAARMKELASGDHPFNAALTIQEYVTVFREAGIGDETEAVEVVAARIRASAVREQLVAALDDWALRVQEEPVRRAWLLAVARAADPDPWRDHFRDPAVWEDRATLERLAREAKVSELSPLTLFALAGALEIRGADAVPLLTAAQRRHPSDFWLNSGLGGELNLAKRSEQAIGYYRAALALRPATSELYVNLGGALVEIGRVDEAVAAFQKAIELGSAAHGHTGLSRVLLQQGRFDEVIAECQKAIEIDPKLVAPRVNLGLALMQKGLPDDAIAQWQKAIAIDPKSTGATAARLNLGKALHDMGRPDDAIAQWQKVVELEPKSASGHYNIGLALRHMGRLDEAIAEYKKAIALEPNYAIYHYYLGVALVDKGQWDDAVAEFRQAIALDSKYAPAHNNLGSALRQKGRLDEAIDECSKAVELDPKFAGAHNNLGNALRDKGRLDDAIVELHKAIDLDFKYAPAHNNLGNALRDKHRLDDAIKEYKEAIELDHKYAAPHNNLGNTLRDKGRLDDAIDEFHKAIELDRKFALAHSNLGLALLAKGRLDDAIAQFQKALAIDPSLAEARGYLAYWKPIAALQSKLPSLLEGKFQPHDNAERLHMAQLCAFEKKYPHAAAQLFADAFAAEPLRAEDLLGQHRYNAACCAALTAAGQGEDAAKADEKERAGWRRQALDWLRADLNAYGKILDGGNAAGRPLVQQSLQHWQSDPDLSGIRDTKELAKLSAEERQAYEKLWADVGELEKKAGQETK